MPRERDGYRGNIELLNSRFPNHDMLCIEDLMQVTGYKSKDTVRKHFKLKNGRISKDAVARWMCG